MAFHRLALLLALLAAPLARAAEKTQTVKASNWHSKGDAFKSELAVRAVKGVTRATADFASRSVTVVYDDAVASRAQIEKALADAGYATPR